ncbi:DUF2812 domain-containing protein [Anaerotignum sp.]
MSKSVIRVSPFGGFDIPGLESWLESMAAKGLRFSMTTGPLCCFEKTDPETVRIHLEPIQGAANDNPELNELYENAGWHYWGIFRGSFYVFASSNPEAESHTDAETLSYALSKFFKGKLISGVLLVLANILLLGLYHNGAPWEISMTRLQYYPVETLSNGSTIPFMLSLLGLLLIDISYLIGLFHLLQYRKAIKSGSKVRGHKGTGWLLIVGLLILLPVFINSVQLFMGRDYSPYDLKDSGFVTLTDIEGEDFRLTGDRMFNMDYISHGGTLLDPEYWYFQQYGTVRHDQSINDVPHLEISITRYPLEILAELRTEEWSRQKFNGSGDYEQFDVLDECLYAKREGRTHVSEITGETRVFLPGGILVLRRGNTVLFADYYGEQDLSTYFEQFAKMMIGL